MKNQQKEKIAKVPKNKQGKKLKQVYHVVQAIERSKNEEKVEVPSNLDSEIEKSKPKPEVSVS